jgi:hypothetical protein
MRRWLDPKWYGFLWQRKDRRGPVVVVVLLLLALGAGGYAAASSMNGSDKAVGVVRVEALKQKVRVQGRERVVTRYVTLATTDFARPSTVFRTRLVTRPVVKTVQAAPVVRRQLVYVTGKGSTVTRQQTQTQVATETSLVTITQPSTVVDSRTVTRRVTVTAPVQTVTVTGAIITVTLPAKTVTRTTTVTVTSPTTTTK